jgi:hypothetical protein
MGAPIFDCKIWFLKKNPKSKVSKIGKEKDVLLPHLVPP